MLGTSGAQWGPSEADTQYADYVGRDSFHGWLPTQRRELLPDNLFLPLSVAGWRQPSVPCWW
jgi:hypothetical protein